MSSPHVFTAVLPEACSNKDSLQQILHGVIVAPSRCDGEEVASTSQPSRARNRKSHRRPPTWLHHRSSSKAKKQKQKCQSQTPSPHRPGGVLRPARPDALCTRCNFKELPLFPFPVPVPSGRRASRLMRGALAKAQSAGTQPARRPELLQISKITSQEVDLHGC